MTITYAHRSDRDGIGRLRIVRDPMPATVLSFTTRPRHAIELVLPLGQTAPFATRASTASAAPSTSTPSSRMPPAASDGGSCTTGRFPRSTSCSVPTGVTSTRPTTPAWQPAYSRPGRGRRPPRRPESLGDRWASANAFLFSNHRLIALHHFPEAPPHWRFYAMHASRAGNAEFFASEPCPELSKS